MSSEVFAADALAGSVALVTGGGTNLGRAAAAELLAAGASVVIAGRREDVLAETAAELGARCSWVAGDIRTPEGARAIVAGTLERAGRIDVLLNNAGGQYLTPAEGITQKGWQAVMRLNVGGTLAMCEAAHELAMGPAGGGRIVNTTVSPHQGMPAMAHTGAARAAVEALGVELADRWAGSGVTVCSLAIGRFATASLKKYPGALLELAARTVPLQRLGDPADYGSVVCLLAGPLGAAFNGSTITLDGGFDNWYGAWPPPDVATDADGQVTTETRVSHAPSS